MPGRSSIDGLFDLWDTLFARGFWGSVPGKEVRERLKQLIADLPNLSGIQVLGYGHPIKDVWGGPR